MSIQLLDKTRKINKLLHNSNTSKFVFSDICDILGEILSSNVIVISKKGKVLGISNKFGDGIINEMLCEDVGGMVDGVLNERFLNVLSTKENVNLITLGFTSESSNKYRAIILPIDIAGERLGTFFIYKIGSPYEIDDIIISEYSTTVVGLEMIHSVTEENEQEIRDKQAVSAVISSLSLSERGAIKAVLADLNGKCKGIIVASHISQESGITRSVIVNALKKCESAGVIETHSNGMKGTSIKILVKSIFDFA